MMFEFSKKSGGEPSLGEGRLLRKAGEDEPRQVFADREKKYRGEIEKVLESMGISAFDAVGNEAVISKIAVQTSASDKEVADMLKLMLAEERATNRRRAA